jgi:hypothetical protein
MLIYEYFMTLIIYTGIVLKYFQNWKRISLAENEKTNIYMTFNISSYLNSGLSF